MAQFKSKAGVIAATVGSAIGLGTVWRFPAETQAGGGAAFLLIYTAFLFILGLPLMLGELSLGRAGRSDAVGAFKKLTPGKPWWIVGMASIVVTFLIMIFYMVVGGWTLEYFVQSCYGGLYDGLQTQSHDAFFNGKMDEYVVNGHQALIFTVVFILINIVVLLRGVQKGIERISNIMMPMLFALLLLFCVVSLCMPGAKEGVTYFLYPDFSKVTLETCLSALGQALFSLSLGMGILITYAGYYPADIHLTRTSVTVISMTLLVAILMGLIIFPAAATFNLTDHSLGGTGLIFITLPEIFASMPGCHIWSAMFFLLLFMAALTSTISLGEVTTRFIQDRFNIRRSTAVWIILGPMCLLSAACSLSFGELEWIKVFGMTMFDFLDTLTNNYMLPLIAFCACIYIGWIAPKDLMPRQLSNDYSLRTPAAPTIILIIRYIAPLAIIAMML